MQTGRSLPHRRQLVRWWPVRRFRRWLFLVVVRALVGCVRNGPRGLGRAVLRGLGWISWHARTGDRQVMDRQIALAFPQMDPPSRERLARCSLQSLADNLVDMVRGDRQVQVEEQAQARLRELASARRPVVFLLAHLGAWELLGPVLSSYLPRFAAISANPHNDGIDRWLRRERARRGVRCFDRKQDRLAAARWLRDGGALALLADQRGSIEQLPAPWFGRPAPTAVGPIRLARRFGARLVPLGIRSDGDAHELLLGDEITWTSGEDEQGLLSKSNRALEGLIRQAPDEWIWFHDRYGPSGPGEDG